MEHDKRILTPLILGEYTAKVNTLFFVRSKSLPGHRSSHDQTPLNKCRTGLSLLLSRQKPINGLPELFSNRE